MDNFSLEKFLIATCTLEQTKVVFPIIFDFEGP